MKKNIPALGFVMGMILPILALSLVYLFKFSDITFAYFMQKLLSDGKVAGKVFTLSVLINLAPFVYYTNKRLDYTARGLFFATMVYVVFILLVMYVWN